MGAPCWTDVSRKDGKRGPLQKAAHAMGSLRWAHLQGSELGQGCPPQSPTEFMGRQSLGPVGGRSVAGAKAREGGEEEP